MPKKLTPKDAEKLRRRQLAKEKRSTDRSDYERWLEDDAEEK